MKATIDIPDDPYRKVKAKSALPPWLGALRRYAKNARGRHDMRAIRESIARGRAAQTPSE